MRVADGYVPPWLACPFARLSLAFCCLCVWHTARSEPSLALQPLRVSENQRFLVSSDGTPLFWLGDTAWTVVQKCTRDDSPDQPSVRKFFETRARQGFNIIQCQLASDAASANAYGRAAFVDRRFDRPRVVDGPDNDYWDMADWFIAQAKAHGLYLALLPTWFDSVPNDDPLIEDPAVAYRYGHFIGSRYRNEPHIVWVLGGDPNRQRDCDVDHPPRLAATRAIAEGIADGAGGIERFDGKADYASTLMTYALLPHGKTGHGPHRPACRPPGESLVVRSANGCGGRGRDVSHSRHGTIHTAHKRRA